MKKLSLLFISLFLLGGFSFAREIERKEPIKTQISNIRSLNPETQLSDTEISKKRTFKEDIQTFFSNKKQFNLNTGSCITWNQLLVRDKLSIKAQEASKKIFWLVELSDKINYDTKNLSLFAKNLEKLSFEITQDCVLSDFQEHRQQIRANLDLLKTEIQSLKQYIVRLRNSYIKSN